LEIKPINDRKLYIGKKFEKYKSNYNLFLMEANKDILETKVTNNNLLTFFE